MTLFVVIWLLAGFLSGLLAIYIEDSWHTSGITIGDVIYIIFLTMCGLLSATFFLIYGILHAVTCDTAM